MLDIFHYLRTLKKKPGALPQSSALLQSDAIVKEIYEGYYTTDPKGFLQVLELINDIGAEDVRAALDELSKKTACDYSAEKLRLVHESLSGMVENAVTVGGDRLAMKSKSTLEHYDMLRDLQTRRAG